MKTQRQLKKEGWRKATLYSYGMGWKGFQQENPKVHLIDSHQEMHAGPGPGGFLRRYPVEAITCLIPPGVEPVYASDPDEYEKKFM